MRRLTLHPSLIKPVLVAGGNRALTILLWMLAGLLVWGTRINLLTIALGLSLAIGGQLVLRRLAMADPLWLEVYLRSLQYKGFYRAHSSARAPAARVRPSVPKV